jgi:hypothetical protein
MQGVRGGGHLPAPAPEESSLRQQQQTQTLEAVLESKKISGGHILVFACLFAWLFCMVMGFCKDPMRHKNQRLCETVRGKLLIQCFSKSTVSLYIYIYIYIQANLIVGNGPPGVHFFHTGVRRRKYKLGQTKQNPSHRGLWPRGWGLLVTDRCVLNHHNRTGSFKMKRFEIFCSDPFTQPGEWPER